MRSRQLISVVCLLAIAVQPVLAGLKPCCCTVREVEAPACCPIKSSPPRVGQPSCCATPALHARLAATTCCCELARPLPVDPQQINSRPELPSAALSLATPAALILPTCGLSRMVTEACPLHGPPLLALYCRWLN